MKDATDAEARTYLDAGWWSTTPLSEVVRSHTEMRPGAPAYIVIGSQRDQTLTWEAYDRYATELAAAFVEDGFAPGERIAVLLPDGAAVHICYIAAERAGLVVTGIGARAGIAEIRYLLDKTGAKGLITHDRHRGTPATSLCRQVAEHQISPRPVADNGALRHIVVPRWLGDDRRPVTINGRPINPPPFEQARQILSGRELGTDDLFMLNSTSGTTGLPKCVMHSQNRWFYFHHVVTNAGTLTGDDVFMGAIPAPYGFGLWTAHFTPAILGSPTVVMERFNAEEMMAAIERYKVTVLTCVSTQFLMMLSARGVESTDFSSLRVMFTGGEAVPFERSAAFEDQTGARVLQVFGSNESGAFSRTTLDDSRDQRLRTAGRILDEMHIRVYTEDGAEVHGDTRVGIPAGRGPATCMGYYDDEGANRDLVNSDGWLLMGDIVEIDGDGYLRVIGRTSDFIIRGGKNISAPAVEGEIAEHPDVRLVSVVAMPDEIFGERVCAYVVPKPGTEITLPRVVSFLETRGISRDWFPEHLIVVDELPRSSGGKIAKGELRADVLRRQKLLNDSSN